MALAMSIAAGCAPAPRGVAVAASRSAVDSHSPNDRPTPKKAPAEKQAVPFYKSPWFWGAIGGAVALGAAALLVANAGGPSQIEMRMHIPR
jgi:hypothetical protein